MVLFGSVHTPESRHVVKSQEGRPLVGERQILGFGAKTEIFCRASWLSAFAVLSLVFLIDARLYIQLSTLPKKLKIGSVCLRVPSGDQTINPNVLFRKGSQLSTNTQYCKEEVVHVHRSCSSSKEPVLNFILSKERSW